MGQKGSQDDIEISMGEPKLWGQHSMNYRRIIKTDKNMTFLISNLTTQASRYEIQFYSPNVKFLTKYADNDVDHT